MSFRTPLYELESARGARFDNCHSWEIAEDYGDSMNEYTAVREGVGILDLCYLGKFRVTGRDRVRYLHNMLSNDFKSLRPGKGCHATLLTHQGRMESDVHGYAFEDELWLECPPAGNDPLLATLTKFIIADVVTIEDCRDKLGILSLQGPRSRKTLEQIVERTIGELSNFEHQTLEKAHWVVVHRDRTGCDGYDLWVPVSDVSMLWRRCVEEFKINPVGHEALNWLRMEAGIPWYGVDMDESNLPLEMGLDDAISMSKGCYRGQEIVARVIHRGHLDRRLGAVAVEHTVPPARGSDIQANGNKIGYISSATFSPILGKPLGLAVMKTEYLEPETPVEVKYNDRTHPATVVALPLT